MKNGAPPGKHCCTWRTKVFRPLDTRVFKDRRILCSKEQWSGWNSHICRYEHSDYIPNYFVIYAEYDKLYNYSVDKLIWQNGWRDWIIQSDLGRSHFNQCQLILKDKQTNKNKCRGASGPSRAKSGQLIDPGEYFIRFFWRLARRRAKH